MWQLCFSPGWRSWLLPEAFSCLAACAWSLLLNLWSCCLLILMKEEKVIWIAVLQNWFWVTPSHKWLSRERWAQLPGAKTSLQHGWTQEKSHSYYLAMRTMVEIKEEPQKGREKNHLFRPDIDVHVTGLFMSHSRAEEMSLGNAVPVSLGCLAFDKQSSSKPKLFC